MNKVNLLHGAEQGLSARACIEIVQDRLKERHLHDLQNSGLDYETIYASGCYSATAENCEAILGSSVGSGLAFPYLRPDGCTPLRLVEVPGYIRIKPDKPPIFNGRSAKYLSPTGSSNHLYFPANLNLDVLSDPSVDLIFTEGEKKALCTVQAGKACLGLSGVWCFRTELPDGRKVTLPDLSECIAWEERKVIIIFDSDLAENEQVAKAEKMLARALFSLGADVYKKYIPGE